MKSRSEAKLAIYRTMGENDFIFDDVRCAVFFKIDTGVDGQLCCASADILVDFFGATNTSICSIVGSLRDHIDFFRRIALQKFVKFGANSEGVVAIATDDLYSFC